MTLPGPDVIRRRWVTLAVIGLVTGVFFGWAIQQAEQMPSTCDDVLSDFHAQELLRTQESVSAEPTGTSDNPLTCAWRSSGGPDDRTRRTVTMSVSVGEHRFLGAGAAIDAVRAEARLWHSATSPVAVGDEAVAVAHVATGGAQAYVGVREDRFSILVSYRTSDPDATMAANLAELAASAALRGGPQP